MHYIEIAVGVPSNRGKIIPEEDLYKEVLKARKNNDALYKSYYSFDEEMLDHFKVHKTISSFKGKFYLPKIIIDIDKDKEKMSDSDVWIVASNFIEELSDFKLDPYQIGIWYSGTGYHISLPDIFQFEPSYFLPNEVKATINKYFPEMIDTKPLMRTGLIRVGFTINKKKGLYKVPLTYDEFKEGYAKILEIAQEGKIRTIELQNQDVPNFHHLIVKGTTQEVKVKPTDPTRIITCVQKIYDEGAIEGTRHVNLIRLVSIRRRNGSSYNEVMDLAKIWNKKNNAPLSEKELETQVKYIWDKGYTPSCDDEILKKYCDPKCIYFEKKNLVTQIDTSEHMEIKYIEEVRDSNKIRINLFGLFGSFTPFYIQSKQVVYLIGDTGLGKSALVQNIATKLKDIEILYLNLEVSGELFYRRFIQMDNNMTKEEVEDYYKEHNNSLSEGINHIKLINTPIDIDTLKRIVAENNFKIIFVDVIEKIRVKGLLGNDKIDKIGEVLRELANKYKIIVFGIHHISKSAATNKDNTSKSLTVHSGKYSSSLEQSADIVLGIMGDQKDSYRYLQVLKARDENYSNIQLAYNVSTLKFNSIR